MTFCLIGLLNLSSCAEEELICLAIHGGTNQGSLKLLNKSLQTIQELIVERKSRGTIGPGESKRISLSPGSHEIEMLGISGGGGCNISTVIIAQCKTTKLTCSH